MVRELVENAITLVEERERKQVEEEARRRVEERLLDLLAPPPVQLRAHDERHRRGGRTAALRADARKDARDAGGRRAGTAQRSKFTIEQKPRR